MNRFNALVVSLAILASGYVQAQDSAKAPSPAQELIAYAAADFKMSGDAPNRFRHVRLGRLAAEDGTHRMVLCGDFLSSGTKPRWTPFATIKTSPYEQWLGGHAKSFCSAPGFKPQSKQDFSADLKRQIDAP